MCLNNPVVRARTLFKGKKKITVWKKVRFYNNTNPAKVVFDSCLYNHNWKVGENVSTRDMTKLWDFELSNKEVEYGFHIYVKEPSQKFTSYTVIALEANVEDYVCHEKGLKEHNSEAVFTKLTLSKKEFNRIKKLEAAGNY